MESQKGGAAAIIIMSRTYFKSYKNCVLLFLFQIVKLINNLSLIFPYEKAWPTKKKIYFVRLFWDIKKKKIWRKELANNPLSRINVRGSSILFVLAVINNLSSCKNFNQYCWVQWAAAIQFFYIIFGWPYRVLYTTIRPTQIISFVRKHLRMRRRTTGFAILLLNSTRAFELLDHCLSSQGRRDIRMLRKQQR